MEAAQPLAEAVKKVKNYENILRVLLSIYYHSYSSGSLIQNWVQATIMNHNVKHALIVPILEHKDRRGS